MYASHIFKRIGTCSCSGSGGQYIIHNKDMFPHKAFRIAEKENTVYFRVCVSVCLLRSTEDTSIGIPVTAETPRAIHSL